MNKLMKNAYECYQQSTDYTLYSVYGSFSYDKMRAFEWCEDVMKNHKGFSLKIISYNTFIFTCGFEFFDENGKRCFCYITPSHIRKCEIDF